MWFLNRALTDFRDAVNRAYPHRDKGSDGTIGDSAHQSRDSDHNEDPDGSVDAWDMDVELNGVGKPYAEDVELLKRTFERHESSKYWIHNDQIATRAEGWKPRSYAYAGVARNKHTRHVHFNTRESHEGSSASWVITKGNDVGMLEGEQARQLSDTHWVVAQGIPNPSGPGRVPLQVWAAYHTATVKALTAAVAQLAQAIASGTGISPEALKAAVAEAVAQSAQTVADAVVDEQVERLQE